MKISHFLWLALISISLTIIACKDKKDEATTEPQSTEGQMTSPEGEGIVVVDPTAGTVATPGAGTSGGTEQHYKCTKAGCTGGGTAAGKCPVCGTDLVHNPAFHAQSAGAPGATPDNAVQVNPQGGTATTKPAATPPPTMEAKNAKGEYHYKCAKGHPGAASAGNCGTCGEPLVHNQAFHAN